MPAITTMSAITKIEKETEDVNTAGIDARELENKVKEMYRDVALDPFGDYHFEMGREMAERLGYAPEDLDRIPSESIDSFAGVGYYFDRVNIQKGDRVVDFGSGSGMDTFVAALKVGETGSVLGIDMCDEQLEKARTLRDGIGFNNVSYEK